jgi:hypothetical protein
MMLSTGQICVEMRRVSRAQGTFGQLLERALFVGPCLYRAIHGIIYWLAREMTQKKADE